MTEEQIQTIAARIAKGHGIPMENALFIARQVLKMEGEMKEQGAKEATNGNNIPIPCERCGKTIAHLIDGNFVAVDRSQWGMSDDEQELCVDCLHKEEAIKEK